MSVLEPPPFLLQQHSHLARKHVVLGLCLYTQVSYEKLHAALPTYFSVWGREEV